jgi:hypothetical protein
LNGETHVLASEGFQRISRLNDSKAFGIALDEILVLVMLQERLPFLAAVFTPASVLLPRCLGMRQREAKNGYGKVVHIFCP